MPYLNLKPNHKAIRTYYQEIKEKQQLSFIHEGAVAPHFAKLLDYCGKRFKWSLIEQYPIKRKGKRPLQADGALLDEFKLVHGIWEAKDTNDDLPTEVKKKFKAGYPQDNILFQAPDRAILYQNGSMVIDTDITEPTNLIDVLKLFLEYQPPEYEQWELAVEEFKEKVPDLAQSLLKLIEDERKVNRAFVQALEDFTELVQQAINPNISLKAVEEMLIQHLLTERIFRKVFNNPDFANRNIIAVEIEKVIQALTSRHFSRTDFLSKLDRFYGAIETTAATIEDFSQKQDFLNTVYEKFFQGFSVKIADTHGIVYTPQPIVDFMVRSVDDILQKEFGKSLSHKDVHILDPFVGTGNFILRIMQQIPRTQLPHKFAHELHCNEVMLLPYYIAAMNIEHEYFELTGQYRPFEGICMVDTFELAEGQQISMFAKENTARVQQQQRTPITVIIGNPPYNVGQINENDNNKNRKYLVMDERVSETYAKDSNATLVNQLSDPYVKAIRWAADRIGEEGIVAFVTNNSFVDGLAFDGMRKHLIQDFDSTYILDLGGNVRKNPKISGTTHNVFGIQVGVSINIFIRRREWRETPTIHYFRTDKFWRKEQKYDFLDAKQYQSNIEWQEIQPNKKFTWLTEGLQADFETFVSIGNKARKRQLNTEVIFLDFSNGVKSNNDAYVYNFSYETIEQSAQRMVEDYNSQRDRYLRHGQPKNLDLFLDVDETRLKWIRNTKRNLRRGTEATLKVENIRRAIYRPYSSRYYYFDPIFSEDVYQLSSFLPSNDTGNLLIVISDKGHRASFAVWMIDKTPDLHLLAATDTFQCFPFYTYDEDSSNRRENITDWALEQYQTQYQDDTITKWDIFHYVYALLHHPTYRDTYAANLRRELPRIPFINDFWSYAKTGARLAEIHVNYEQQPEYTLQFIENPDEPLNWRVEKMRLSKDKTQLKYNEFLTLAEIPSAVFDYRLGNRSALDWIIDQYRVKTDKRSGIVNDPNNLDDEQYIVRLIGQVITISLETVELVNGLPEWEIIGEGTE